MFSWNGKIFNSLSELQNDPNFQELPEQTRQYLISVFNGNIPMPTNNEPPRTVTPRQFRTALILKGFDLNSISNFIESLPSPQKEIAKVAWEYSTEFHRENPLLNQFSAAYGITQQQLDEIFILAATL